jgi:hypothetical protein
MRTDRLFHEYFQLAPEAFLRSFRSSRHAGIVAPVRCSKRPSALTHQISRKFGVAPEVVMAILRRLRLKEIEALSEIVLEATSFTEIREWVEQRTNKINRQANGNY